MSIIRALAPISGLHLGVVSEAGVELACDGCRGVSSTPECWLLMGSASCVPCGITVSHWRAGVHASSLHGCRVPDGPASQEPEGISVSQGCLDVIGSSTHGGWKPTESASRGPCGTSVSHRFIHSSTHWLANKSASRMPCSNAVSRGQRGAGVASMLPHVAGLETSFHLL